MQTCTWPSWCHSHSLSLASVKSRLVFSLYHMHPTWTYNFCRWVTILLSHTSSDSSWLVIQGCGDRRLDQFHSTSKIHNIPQTTTCNSFSSTSKIFICSLFIAVINYCIIFSVELHSVSFGWGKGRNVTTAGWLVTLCDPIWNVSFHSGEASC